MLERVAHKDRKMKRGLVSDKREIWRKGDIQKKDRERERESKNEMERKLAGDRKRKSKKEIEQKVK